MNDVVATDMTIRSSTADGLGANNSTFDNGTVSGSVFDGGTITNSKLADFDMDLRRNSIRQSQMKVILQSEMSKLVKQNKLILVNCMMKFLRKLHRHLKLM